MPRLVLVNFKILWFLPAPDAVTHRVIPVLHDQLGPFEAVLHLYQTVVEVVEVGHVLRDCPEICVTILFMFPLLSWARVVTLSSDRVIW